MCLIEVEAFILQDSGHPGAGLETPGLVYKLYLTYTHYGSILRKCYGHFPKMNQINYLQLYAKESFFSFFFYFLLSPAARQSLF